MHTGRPATNQPPVKIYNAVYSSVQVYECMIRGIAVMRRRGDSYVNATQILKVAGVDKGRRTKILEKEILPGKHEIVQGGYGKYQGTWIPLERGRDIALQYGVLPLLAPLFDFTPSTNSLAALPVSTPNISASPRPLSASSSYSSLGNSGMPGMLAPPPIMPGSALRLLNQGRAQGLFTPSTSSTGLSTRTAQSASPALPYNQPQSPFTAASQTPPPSQTLKRQRSDTEVESAPPAPDVQMADVPKAPPTTHPQINGTVAPDENPSPAKRARKESTPPNQEQQAAPPSADGNARPASVVSGKQPSVTPSNEVIRHPRFATKPSFPRNLDPTVPLKDTRRTAVISSICQADDPTSVLGLLRDIAPLPAHQNVPSSSQSPTFDVDTILDDQGHTALHLASSLSRQATVRALLAEGADVHRGNHLGETPLIRTILSTHAFSAQSLPDLLGAGLAKAILTVDTSRKSVLHHIVSLAGVKGRAASARYYLDQVFLWIAQKMDADFACIVDLQDEHGDTPLNIAARVGNRSMVRVLLDVGANKTLMNKLGLRPGDFGVESEELSGGPKAEDIAAMLRSAPSAPVQKSQDVIADMTAMIQNLSAEFQSEIKVKQDALDVTQAHLRVATRELSEQRRQIQSWQTKCAEMDTLGQRVKNLEKALEEEDMWDWTGRSGAKIVSRKSKDSGQEEAKNKDGDIDMDADASADEDEEALPLPAPQGVPPAFRYRGTSSSLVGTGTDMSDVAALPSFNVDPDPPIPPTSTVESFIKLRRMRMWQLRMEELMEERLRGLRGASAEKEFMCRRIVSLCTGVPVEKVEEMLDNLVIAVETEGSVLDITRVSGFMQKVSSIFHVSGYL
uniref:Putative transcription factor n=1 Tax=Moniliophthora roreri TaxID=221103 RepID=A0A0W0FZ61_MONRR